MSGRFRHKIYFQSVANTADGKGGWTEVWTTQKTTWAEILPVRGTEAVDLLKVTAQNAIRIRCRYISGITPQYRVVKAADSKTYKILSVIQVAERMVLLEIIAEEWDV